ncbi:ABC transporter permease [Candidatus Woesearchaeota archaeon]|nr:ABC transporter permease [Candidatus Woesearchaeota archaeon]
MAIRSLSRRKLRSWLTMIGIFIGIAAVVSLISLGQGMQNAIEEQFFQLGADKLTIQTKGPSFGPPGSNTDLMLMDSDLEVVKRSRGVKIAASRLVEPIRVEFNEKEKFIFVATLPQESKEREMVIEVANVDPSDMIAGRPLKQSDQWKVIMSEDYLEPKFDNKGLQVGDKVKIDGQAVEVVGMYKKTGNPMVDMAFVMNEDPVRELLDLPKKSGLIVAQVTPGIDMALVVENIEKDLRQHRNLKEGKEDFEVESPEDLLDSVSTILNVVTAVLVGIAGISLLVGGIGIMNTMYTSVLERRKEIGILKAIGARNSDVLGIFLVEAGVLGLIGGTIGILLGIAFSKTVEIIATIALGTTLIQASFPWYLILGSLAFSFGVGSLAGTYPAMQASKLPPVEALRQ